MTERATPRTRRGADAVQAAIEEFELRQRLDEAGPELTIPGDYDLAWAHGRIDTARRAAEADVITADEALEWLAEAIGRELPSDDLDEDYERE